MHKECNIYARQLKRLASQKFNLEQLNIRINVKGFSHDFGVYYEVVCRYPDDNKDAVEAIYWLEENLPMNWDTEAKTELHALGVAILLNNHYSRIKI
jgi:hypothetical protein